MLYRGISNKNDARRLALRLNIWGTGVVQNDVVVAVENAVKSDLTSEFEVAGIVSLRDLRLH